MSADTLNGQEYYDMPSGYSERPAQLPLRKERFEYLLNQYLPKQSDRWVMFNHPNHFLIHDKSSGFCVYDAEYVLFEDSESDNPIAAVITSFRINQSSEQHPSDIVDDFDTIRELLTKTL